MRLQIQGAIGRSVDGPRGVGIFVTTEGRTPSSLSLSYATMCPTSAVSMNWISEIILPLLIVHRSSPHQSSKTGAEKRRNKLSSRL
jgi:hypothetical protein